jgi:hypothetical protein
VSGPYDVTWGQWLALIGLALGLGALTLLGLWIRDRIERRRRP